MQLTDLHRLLAVFALNSFHNTLALMMALRVLRVRIRPLFVCFASLLGAFAALASGIAGLSRGMNALLWLPIALTMMRAAAGCERGLLRVIRRALVLLACEGFLGGVVLALYGASGSLMAAHMLSALVGGAVFVSAWRAQSAAGDVRRVRVICCIGGREIAFDAIVDSGNSLRDYLTHRPVIVAGVKLYEKIDRSGMRMRPIFADTAGGRQMMQLTMPERTTIVLDCGQKRVEAALAFSPALCADMPALVPASLLE